MKILTVDDDRIFLDIMNMELTAIGEFEVLQAESAKDALELVDSSAKPFDCFFLDILMPEIDGIELCALLRMRNSTRGIPIIMVTMETDIESVDRAFSAGATDYLTKPLSSRELRGRVQMAQELAKERNSNFGKLDKLQFEVSDPLSIESVKDCVSYLAIQNYLLRLGTMKRYSRIAVGIYVSNIEKLFATMPSDEFRLMIIDLASAISECFSGVPKMISYAGSGCFVVLLNRILGFDRDEVIDTLAPKLSDLKKLYEKNGREAPKLNVGPAVAPVFSLFNSADDLLHTAIDETIRNGVDVGHN